MLSLPCIHCLGPSLLPFPPTAELFKGLPTNFCLALAPCQSSLAYTQANWEEGGWERAPSTLRRHFPAPDLFQAPGLWDGDEFPSYEVKTSLPTLARAAQGGVVTPRHRVQEARTHAHSQATHAHTHTCTFTHGERGRQTGRSGSTASDSAARVNWMHIDSAARPARPGQRKKLLRFVLGLGHHCPPPSRGRRVVFRAG